MISEPVLIINNNINKDRVFLCGGRWWEYVIIDWVGKIHVHVHVQCVLDYCVTVVEI